MSETAPNKAVERMQSEGSKLTDTMKVNLSEWFDSSFVESGVVFYSAESWVSTKLNQAGEQHRSMKLILGHGAHDRFLWDELIKFFQFANFYHPKFKAELKEHLLLVEPIAKCFPTEENLTIEFRPEGHKQQTESGGVTPSLGDLRVPQKIGPNPERRQKLIAELNATRTDESDAALIKLYRRFEKF